MPVVATPKLAKLAKWGLSGPLATQVTIGAMGHGAGGAIAWAATNSKLGKLGKFGEFVYRSKFSPPIQRWPSGEKSDISVMFGHLWVGRLVEF